MVEELFTGEEKKLVSKTKLPNIWRLRNEKKRAGRINDTIEELKKMVEKPETDKTIMNLCGRIFPTLKK